MVDMPYKMTDKQKDYQRRWVAEKRKKVLLSIFEGKACERCGFDDIRALEFHHKDRSKRSFTITSQVTIKLERLMNEIDKCEIICANCHSIEHSRFNPDGAYR